MALVLHHSKATGTAKLVLLGIANHDGDGGAWPSARTLSKYAGLGGKKENRRRRIKRIVRELVGLGELRVLVNQGGTRDDDVPWTRPNLYRVLVTCPPECDRTTAHRVPDPDDDTPDELVGPFTLTTPDPVDNPQVGGGRTTPGGSPDPGGRGVVQPPEPSSNNHPHMQLGASTTDRTRELLTGDQVRARAAEARAALRGQAKP